MYLIEIVIFYLSWYCSLLAHVIEEIYEAERGVEFMTSTREDWGNTIFAGHLTWHLTLYYYGKLIAITSEIRTSQIRTLQ